MFGNGFMTIHGTRVPVVGVICMDQCMIDVTDILEVEVGDWVTIYGDGTDNMLSVEDVARFGSTNKNEIISQITRRTLKIYRQNGEISKVKNYLDWENFYANNERKGS